MLLKKILISILCSLFLFAISPKVLLADEFVTTINSDGSSAQNENTGTDKGTIQDDAGITPDSPLYPVERLIENIQIALTFSAEGKAELLIEFANERLAEAQIMTEQNRQDLVHKVMKVFAKTIEIANNKAKEAAENDKDVTNIIEKIEVIETEASSILIKATGVIPEEAAETLKEAISVEVKKTLAVKAFAVAKANFFEAKKQFEAAKEEFKKAQETGDETEIQVALEKLKLAEKYKNEMEQLKDNVDEYKENLKQELDNTAHEQEEAEKALEEKEDKEKEQQEKELEQAEKEKELQEELGEKMREESEEKQEEIEEEKDKQQEEMREQQEELKEEKEKQQEEINKEEEKREELKDNEDEQDDEQENEDHE